MLYDYSMFIASTDKIFGFSTSTHTCTSTSKGTRTGTSTTTGRQTQVQASPVIRVLHPDSQLVAIMELLLEGGLHGLWVQHSCTEEGQLSGFIIGEQGNRPGPLDQPGV